MESHIAGIIIMLLCIIYGMILQNLSGKRANTHVMLKAFGLVFTFGWIIHMWIFHMILSSSGSQSFLDWMMMVYFSVQYTLEMFVTKTLVFKGNIINIIGNGSLLFNLYMLAYYMAVITSALIIFHFISRWLYGRRWLDKNSNIMAAKKGGNHIFLGISNASMLLARSIREEGCNGKIIFIDIPNDDDTPKTISAWELITQFIFRSEIHEDINADAILRAGKNMKGLMPWLMNPDNNLYILSDDQENNLEYLEMLWQNEDVPEEKRMKCHIYCHAEKDGLVSRYDSVTDIHNRITFVDSSFLSVQSLKKHDTIEMYPVNYVDVGTDPVTGRKTGWVKSGFSSAVIGFGETGQEALKFLYEFGAFVGKDKKKVPFRCHIFDKDIAKASGDFKRKITLPDSKEVTFVDGMTDTSKFWEQLDTIISDVNYIVVCLGNDMLNLKTSIDIAEFALRKGRELNRNFVIAVKLNEYSALGKDTLDKANKTLRGCIKPFGMAEDIWTLKVIRNNDMDYMARKFYLNYLSMTESQVDESLWYEREKKLRDNDYKTRCKVRRQIAQDYSNCLHILTKKALCDNSAYEAAGYIRQSYDGTSHVSKDCPETEAATLEYLAIGEHLRWNASHIILGYRYGQQTCDLKGTHNCIVPYSDLSEDIRHYDWLVVKNSLTE